MSNATTLEPIQTQDQPSYTVDSLVERMGVKANATLWKSIESINIIRVQGRVGKIKAYNSGVYFDFPGAENKITVKCDRSLSPKEGEYIVIEGTPTFRPSKFSTGLDIVISGVPISQMEIKEASVDTPLPNLDKPRYIRLYDFFKDRSLQELLILGTDTAIKDVYSQLDAQTKEILPYDFVR